MSATLFDTDTAYPEDFTEAWKAFRAPPNSSKSDALKAWHQSAKHRIAIGAVGNKLLGCIAAYNQFVAYETMNRRKARQSDYPKLHFSTFLRQQRYEGFMGDAERIVAQKEKDRAAIDVITQGWEDEAASLIREISDVKFNAWFQNVQVRRDGPRPELIFPTLFRARYVATNFVYPMRRVFGDCEISAAGSRERFSLS